MPKAHLRAALKSKEAKGLRLKNEDFLKGEIHQP
jgi:hypothetical protein